MCMKKCVFLYILLFLFCFKYIIYVTMRLELVTKKYVSHVELVKDEKYCLGVTIADGTNDEAGPVVKKVKLKSPAGKSFAIVEGDVILSLNGYSAVGNKSKDLIRMLKESGNDVILELQYETKELCISRPGIYRTQQLTTELQKINNSFGFILRKNPNLSNQSFLLDYPVISNIVEGSEVHRSSRILEGDRLLKVDDRSLYWLSLTDIACLLQEKDKAEFTFEYDISIVNFEENEMKVDLDIDIPVADLGMYLSNNAEEFGRLYVDYLRLGSIAERCGIFCYGDIILSINEIDAKYLTPSKANVLLNNKKLRKISFIPSKRNEVKSYKFVQDCCSSRETSASSLAGCHADQDGKQHVNTPASSNAVFSTRRRSYFKDFCHSEQQTEEVSKLKNIVKVMIALKENLSLFSWEDFEKISRNLRENCTSCHEPQNSGQICASCLTEITTSCKQSMNVLQSMTNNFLTFSSRNSANLCVPDQVDTQAGSNEVREYELVKIPTVEVVHALTDTLPKVFSNESQLQEQFKVLARKVMNADASCSICVYEVKSVWIIVQKLFLLLSLGDSRPEIRNSINQLISCLLDMKFSCDSESGSQFSSDDDDNSFRSESISSIYLLPFIGDAGSVRSDVNYFEISREPESNVAKDSNESSINIQQKNMRSHYLKITHIQSVSEQMSTIGEFCRENNFREAGINSKCLVEKDCVSPKANIEESSSSSPNAKDTKSNSDTNIYRDKWLRLAPSKVWRSLDSVLRPQKSTKQQPEIQNKLSSDSSRSRITNSKGNPNGNSHDADRSTNQLVNNLSPNHRRLPDQENNSYSSSKSTRSSLTNPPHFDKNAICTKKTHTDTVEVKMINKGEGFGLILGVKYCSRKSSIVPIIHSIKPKSPSQKSGILKIDDRIIAINHQCTLGLTPKELQTLKKRSFSADTITLTVEFDVEDAELKFGTFDVVLDKTIRIGLIFEDMKRGFPMIVSGIAKGSGAHRCGQLFPGDKIRFFRCIRNEEFDPVSCNYSKEESVLITVQRDPKESLKVKSENASPCYFNPSFSHQDSVPRKGTTFVVKSTTVHAVGGTEALMLDQEVTLFRDPVYWDFGFLVGENPETGRAYVTDVRPDGPAFKSGVIKKFDRIIEVNGILVDRNIENSVLSLLSQANHKVDLLIRRLYREDSNCI